MKILVIFLSLIVFFVVALFIWNAIQRRKGNIANIDEVSKDPVDGECCGQHAVCEKESLLNAFNEEIEYFDDEELDEYRGVPSDAYPEIVVDEFREILYSIYDDEKPRWVRSLQKRDIAIPDQLKDEIFMIVNDIRTNR